MSDGFTASVAPVLDHPGSEPPTGLVRLAECVEAHLDDLSRYHLWDEKE